MPTYTWLRPREHDDESTTANKLRATRKLRALRSALGAHIEGQSPPDGVELPAESSKVVRLATWNLREFDSASYGYRTPEAKAYIAEIIAHFDLIALQEIRHDLGALEEVMGLLGPNWGYITTDVTEGSSGNGERMAFVYNRNKVWFRNVAGELTLPKGHKVSDPFGERFRVEGGAQLELPGEAPLTSPTGLRTKTLTSGATKVTADVEIPLPEGTKLVLPPGAAIHFPRNARVPLTADDGIDLDTSQTPLLPESAELVLPPNSLRGTDRQFARTPFVVSFQSGWLKLNLATVHIFYGKGNAGIERRKKEIQRLTELLAGRAKNDSDSDADAYFIALGDFNIVAPDHGTMDALRTNDFHIPEPLTRVPGSNVKKDKHYDQIALWTGASTRRNSYTQIRPYRAGVFDYFETVFRTDEEAIYRPLMGKPGTDDDYADYSRWRTYQMSDHLPMWIELHADFAEEYLDEIEEALEKEAGDS